MGLAILSNGHTQNCQPQDCQLVANSEVGNPEGSRQEQMTNKDFEHFVNVNDQQHFVNVNDQQHSVRVFRHPFLSRALEILSVLLFQFSKSGGNLKNTIGDGGSTAL